MRPTFTDLELQIDKKKREVAKLNNPLFILETSNFKLST